MAAQKFNRFNRRNWYFLTVWHEWGARKDSLSLYISLCLLVAFIARSFILCVQCVVGRSDWQLNGDEIHSSNNEWECARQTYWIFMWIEIGVQAPQVQKPI